MAGGQEWIQDQSKATAVVMIVYTAMGTVDLEEHDKSERYLEVSKEWSTGTVV